MDEQKYRIRMNERAIELLMHKDEYDPDIWNLEYMITQIMPYSTNWRSGCIRSLRKAINALKEEKNMFDKEKSKMKLKPGDRVVMNDNYHVSPANKGKVWKVVSEPWMVCGSKVVKLEGRSSGYAVDGLDLVSEGGDSYE